MRSSSLASRDRQLGREASESNLPSAVRDPSVVGSLTKVVRRILRTQACRTAFQLRVLAEARRLLDEHLCELARDTLERLVVDQLLGNRQEESEESMGFAAQAVEAICPPTLLPLSHSTLTCHSTAD